MSDPWKETWRALAPEFGPWPIVDEHGNAVGTIGSGCSGPGAAKLAAAAPEMARVLLLIVESEGHPGQGPVTLGPMEIAGIRLLLRKAGVPSPGEEKP